MLFRNIFWVLSLLLSAPALASGELPHSGIVLKDGSIWGWGGNHYGQLGTGLPAIVSAPAKLATAGEGDWQSVATGSRHTLAQDTQGRVWAWGDNSSGQLGLGHTRPVRSPSPVTLGPIRSLAAGVHHSLALDRSGQVLAWGGNSLGQLGNGREGPLELEPTPKIIEGLAGISMVKAGDRFSLALDRGGTVWIWGANAGTRPGKIANLPPMREIQASGMLALASDGKNAWRWQPGQLPESVPLLTFDEAGSLDLRQISLASGIVTHQGKPLAGASVFAGQNLCGSSGQDGRYQCALAPGKYVFQPRKQGVDFAPRELNLLPGQHDIPFVTSAPKVSIAGVIRSPSSVQVNASGQQVRCIRQNRNRSYLCSVPQGWSGSITFRASGKILEERRFERVTQSLSHQDFPAARKTALAKPAEPKASAPTKTAEPSASAQFALKDPIPAAPSRLTEPPKTPTEAAPQLPAMDKSAPPAVVSISGTIFLATNRFESFPAAGGRLADTTVRGEGANCIASNTEGKYTCTVKRGWSGRLSAGKTRYFFTPNALIYQNVQQNLNNQDFSGFFDPQ